MVNTVNFGNLNQWRWLQQCYGSNVIQDTLQNVPSTELRPPAKELAQVLFHITLPQHVSRNITRTE